MKTILWLIILAVVQIRTTCTAQAQEILRLGTVAPRQGPYSEIIRQISLDVEHDSKGAIRVDVTYDAGGEGGEPAMIPREDLDGWAISVLGLSGIDTTLAISLIPWRYRSWADAERAKKALRTDAEVAFRQKSYELLATADIGILRVLSKKMAIHAPHMLANQTVVAIDGDVVSKPFHSLVNPLRGKSKLIMLPIPQVLPRLKKGDIDVFIISPLAAELFQWAPYFHYVVTTPVSFACAAIIIKKDRFDRLPAPLRVILRETTKRAAEKASRRLRDEDDKAFERIRSRMTAVTPNQSDEAKWRLLSGKLLQKFKNDGTPFTAQQLEKSDPGRK